MKAMVIASLLVGAFRFHRRDRSVELTPQALAYFDAVTLLTDHSSFDYNSILEHAPLIVESRGKFRQKNAKVVKA